MSGYNNTTNDSFSKIPEVRTLSIHYNGHSLYNKLHTNWVVRMELLEEQSRSLGMCQAKTKYEA